MVSEKEQNQEFLDNTATFANTRNKVSTYLYY